MMPPRDQVFANFTQYALKWEFLWMPHTMQTEKKEMDGGMMASPNIRTTP